MTEQEFTGKYWPKLFKPHLMKRIADRSKSQTRRPLTWRNTWFDGGKWPKWAKDDLSQFDWERAWVYPDDNDISTLRIMRGRRTGLTHEITPKVKVGDRFWTKEKHTFATLISSTVPGSQFGDVRVIYEALCDPVEKQIIDGHWKPSIFQKIQHSRFHLPVTRVRIQRVQDITESDARAEGVLSSLEDLDPRHGFLPNVLSTEPNKMQFATTWEDMYGGKPGKWEDNRWIIAYNFTAMEVNHDTD